MKIILVIILAVTALLGLPFSVLTHELFHYKAAYDFSKCDSVILIRTRIFKALIEHKWKSGHRTKLRFVPKAQWETFEMDDCLGRVYFSNEYKPYSNKELKAISRAGLYGSFLGYLVISLSIGLMYGIIIYSEPRILESIFHIASTARTAEIIAVAVFIATYLMLVIFKAISYFRGAKIPGWNDYAIECDPYGYKQYLDELNPNGPHTYQGIVKMI